MAKGYWIVRVDIDDPDQYKKYTLANSAPLKKYGARFLVRAGQFQAVEGTARSRNASLAGPTTTSRGRGRPRRVQSRHASANQAAKARRSQARVNASTNESARDTETTSALARR